jgi:hypothetical protein
MRAVAESCANAHRLIGRAGNLPATAPSRRLLRVILTTQFANALTQFPNLTDLYIVRFGIARVDLLEFGFHLHKLREEARNFGGRIWPSHKGFRFC